MSKVIQTDLVLVFDGESGHLITALLRAGNTHASNSSVALLKRLVTRLRERWPEVAIEIRADAGFAVPAIYDYCEREGITYTIALITNPRLLEMAEELLGEAKEDYEQTGYTRRSSSVRISTKQQAGKGRAGSSTKPRQCTRGRTGALLLPPEVMSPKISTNSTPSEEKQRTG